MLFSKPAKSLRPGDRVIFTLRRRSSHPQLGAKEVRPERHGEGYLYRIDNFWIVAHARDSQVLVKTSHNRFHLLETADPRLQLASWWQRLIYHRQFPKPDSIAPRQWPCATELASPRPANDGVAHV